MVGGIYRRCGCRDANHRAYGVLPVKGATVQQVARACPKMLTDAKHGSFSWRLSRGFDPATGKRVVVNGGSFPTLKAAQTALNKAKVKKDEGTLHKPATQTLASYAAEWLPRRQTMGKRPLAPTTALNYGRYIKQDIAPSRLGKMKLTDIRRSDVQAFVDSLTTAGRGATTTLRILATLQSILTGAMKDELVPTNVARGVEGPTVNRREKQIWTPEELGAFLEVASGHRLGALFELALHTALRRGEVCGLRWDDVDFDRAVITIRHNRVLVGSTVVDTTPKTDHSAAEVELSPAASQALQGWRVRQDLERQDWGDAWRGDGHVFTYEDGRALDPSYVTKLFGSLVKMTEDALREHLRNDSMASGLPPEAVDRAAEKRPATLPRLTLHGLRHLAASYMWNATGDILAVSKALRHSSPTVTSTVYAHFQGGKQRAIFGTIATQLESVAVHALHTQGPVET